jgi:putative transposase
LEDTKNSLYSHASSVLLARAAAREALPKAGRRMHISVSYRSNSRHSVGESNFHFQFTPKYRRDIFKDAILKKACESSFRTIAARWGVTLLAVEFGPEHVHLFVGNCRKFSVDQLARYFKGASSRELRKKHWDRIKHKLWGDSFWSDGYFYESIGRVTSETIKYYIERQQGKHWAELEYDVYLQLKGQTKLSDFTS